MKNQKIIIFLILLILLPSNFCFAQRKLEVRYPEIPGAIRPVTIKTELAEYIKYIFGFVLSIAGLITFGSLVWGGITYLTSAGSPERMKEAKSQIFASIFALLIIFSSWLISNTINPQLVIPHAGIEAVGGILLYSEASCKGEERTITRDTPDFGKMADGETDFVARSFKFISRPGELEVVLFDKKNYGGNELRVSSSIPGCYDRIEKKSIQFFWQFPGVYLCTDTYEYEKETGKFICKGEEKYLPADTALLESPFNNNVKGLRIKHPTSSIVWKTSEITREEAEMLCDDRRRAWGGGSFIKRGDEYICTYYTSSKYGVVLHEHAGFSGTCEVFTDSDPNLEKDDNSFTGRSHIIKSGTSSVTIFPRSGATERTGEGVWLCNEPDAQRDDEDCYGPYNKIMRVKNVADEEGIDNIRGCTIGQNGITSIIIDGHYIAILFDGDNFEGECEVFYRSDSNFRDNPMGRCCCILGYLRCQDCLSSFIILPTR